MDEFNREDCKEVIRKNLVGLKDSAKVEFIMQLLECMTTNEFTLDELEDHCESIRFDIL